MGAMPEIMMNKTGKASALLLSLDVIGFALVFMGVGLIRFAKEEVLAALGGFVLAGGVALLSITRLIKP